jgi:hypothetical protein
MGQTPRFRSINCNLLTPLIRTGPNEITCCPKCQVPVHTIKEDKKDINCGTDEIKNLDKETT